MSDAFVIGSIDTGKLREMEDILRTSRDARFLQAVTDTDQVHIVATPHSEEDAIALIAALFDRLASHDPAKAARLIDELRETLGEPSGVTAPLFER